MSNQSSQGYDRQRESDVELQMVKGEEGKAMYYAEGDTTLVEWDGPEDPANPYNWAPSRSKLCLSAEMTAVGRRARC